MELIDTNADRVDWELLRLWHVEVLCSVAESPQAVTFTRTSYGLVPRRWREHAPAELQRRVEIVLEASYRRRNHFTMQGDDPVEMWWIGYAFEWVASATMDPDDDHAGDSWIQTKQPIHYALIERAIDELASQRRMPRSGRADRPWANAFSLFGVDADGEAWKLLRSADPDALSRFDRSLLLPRR